MISVDSSTLIAYVTGDISRDTDLLRAALLGDNKVALCPLVITEMTSVLLDATARELLKKFLLLDFKEGFWERAGASRYRLISKKLKAKVADSIIAQSSIDHGVPLLTRDHDFRHYVTLCGLELA